MKKLLSIILIISSIFVMTIGLASCSGKKSDLAKVKDNKVFYVGITIYEPMDYFDEDGETIIGFDAELANAFAESLGAKAKFVPILWDSKVAELNGGYIDVIWNGMTASEELGKQIDFSVAYATNYQCVVTKSNVESYTSQDVLKTKKVAVEQGSAGDTVLSDIGVNAYKIGSQLDAINEVVAGTSDCCVIDYTMAYSLVGKGNYKDLKIVDADKISFDQEVFAVGLRKGSDLTSVLSKFLKQEYANGNMAKLAEKYSVGLNTTDLAK